MNKKKVKALIKKYKKKLKNSENQTITAIIRRNEALEENINLCAENKKLRAIIKHYKIAQSFMDSTLNIDD